MHDLVQDPDLLRACLVGVGLEPGVGRGAAVQPGDHDGGKPALFDRIVNPGAAADVLAGAFAGDDAPIRYLPDIGDGGYAVAHGVADGDALDLLEGRETGEVGGRKSLASSREILNSCIPVEKRIAVVP